MFLLAEVVFNVATLAWSTSYELAYTRECCYSVMLSFVALEAWARVHRSAYVRQADPFEALVYVVAVFVLGFGAMYLPGRYVDFRGLVPVVLSSGIVLACAVRAGDFGGDALDAAACRWLAVVQVAMVAHLVAYEWSLIVFQVLGWVEVAVFLWALTEIHVAHMASRPGVDSLSARRTVTFH